MIAKHKNKPLIWNLFLSILFGLGCAFLVVGHIFFVDLTSKKREPINRLNCFFCVVFWYYLVTVIIFCYPLFSSYFEGLCVSGRFFDSIGSFLSNRLIKVISAVHSSRYFGIHSCIPRGSILGTNLFLIFINGLLNAIRFRLSILVDDTNISSSLNEKLFSKFTTKLEQEEAC